MKLAACLYVRNEERDIAEWLAFHTVVGFATLIVFDNLSSDRTRQIVRAAGKVRDVRLIPWPLTLARAQGLAYDLCLRLFGREFDWIGFFDSDEFIVPARTDDVKDLLRPLGALAGVAMNYAMFGSSGHQAFPEGLVIESFTRRAPADFDDHRVVKSLIRPRGAWFVTPHAFKVRGAYGSLTGAPIHWDIPGKTVEQPDLSLGQVNHYFTRSRAHWEQKMRRGYRDVVRPESAFAQYDRNEVEDTTALRFVPAVRAEMARY
jgi:hypothetical protein